MSVPVASAPPRAFLFGTRSAPRAVYLVETLHVEAADAAGKPVMTIRPRDDSVAHVKAVCLLRPTPENMRALKQHLAEPRFLEYHLFFTNMVPQARPPASWGAAARARTFSRAPPAGQAAQPRRVGRAPRRKAGPGVLR